MKRQQNEMLIFLIFAISLIISWRENDGFIIIIAYALGTILGAAIAGAIILVIIWAIIGFISTLSGNPMAAQKTFNIKNIRTLSYIMLILVVLRLLSSFRVNH